MAKARAPENAPRFITIDVCIELLQRCGALSDAHISQIRSSVNPNDVRHPFIRIADLGLRSAAANQELLSLESVTRLIAEACDIP
jgi:hypothetical protein